MSSYLVGGLAIAGLAFCLFASYNISAWNEQAEIKRKCEQFGVVDLNLHGAMFYCARKPKPD